MEEVRIQKFLSDCSVASRRKAEQLVEAGAVEINGKKAVIGQKITPGKDRVTVDGEVIEQGGVKKYIMLNKPRGIVTTMQDEKGRRCVADLVEDVGVRVYPVGRLDKDSEGLLLMTNDGEFSNRMMHPSMHVPKTYRVTVRPKITDMQLATLSSGMVIDGYQTSPAQVKILEDRADRTVLQMVIHEGRNRQIRKMCESLNLQPIRLKRIAVGAVKLGMLQPGQWRELTDAEKKLLLKRDPSETNANKGRKRK